MKLKTVELRNKNGVSIKILNYGARIMSIKTPDKHGNLGEIVLGYSTPEEYINGNPYFGACIGRCANRISNGRFSIEDKEYQLNKNIGQDHLHGGPKGFHQAIWEIESVEKEKGLQSVSLTYKSADMEEGYPGELNVKIIYSLNSNNELGIEYFADTNKTTIVNLTHHSFFNLKDGGASEIDSHYLKLNALRFLPMNSKLLPLGNIQSVKNTPMDFTQFFKIGDRINEDNEQLLVGKGYNHNWVLDSLNNDLILAAEVYEEESGRMMEVFTTEPGIQFYSGNFLDGTDVGILGVPYRFRSAFCLETQHFPDSPNHKNFPSIVLRPDQKYFQKTVYKFKTLFNQA